MKSKISVIFSFLTALIVMIALGACTDHGVTVVEEGPGNVDQDTTHQDTTHQDTTHTGAVSFSQAVLPILAANCASNGCHGDIGTQHFLRLNSYDGVMSTSPHQHVFPGNADISPVYLAVTRRFPEVGLGTRMPQGRDTLTTSDQLKIRDWINQGANNN